MTPLVLVLGFDSVSSCSLITISDDKLHPIEHLQGSKSDIGL